MSDVDDNIRTFKNDVFNDCRKFGREAAEGGDALPKMAMRLVDAADQGLIALDKDKRTGKDDVDQAYETYVEGFSSKAIYEHSVNGVKANTSKMRQIVRMTVEAGSKYDPKTVVYDVKSRREALASGEAKIKPMYPALVDAARAQLKLDRQLTLTEIDELVVKQERPAKPIDDVLSKIHEQLEKIVAGEHKSGECNDSRVREAKDKLREYLSGAEAEAQREEDEQALAAILARNPQLAPTTVPESEPELAPAE